MENFLKVQITPLKKFPVPLSTDSRQPVSKYLFIVGISDFFVKSVYTKPYFIQLFGIF